MINKKGQTICVFSSKGGVGKTTTLLAMAGIYASMEKKVLIIDFDVYSGGIALYLNKGTNQTIYNLVDDLSNSRYTDLNKYTIKYNDYINYLASPKDPRQGSKIDNRYVKEIIDLAVNYYDIVLIDTTHVLSNINLTILDNVSKIIFLVTNDPYDLKNLKSLLTIFKELNINNYKIILNNAINPYKKYFSNYDIKNILGANIDYILPKEGFVKDIDKYVMDNLILSLEKRPPVAASRCNEILIKLIVDLNKSGEQNEK